VAVVTRYFGGIKLGAGGLIRAYSNVTTKAIHQAGLVQRIQQATLNITVSYRQHDPLLYYLKENRLELANEQYGANVVTSVFVDIDQIKATIQDLTNRFNNQLEISEGERRFNELPFEPQK
jgi:putative IMPACT (imprinted ancient) family translation regulator